MLYNRKLIVRHFKSNKIKGILADTYKVAGNDKTAMRGEDASHSKVYPHYS